MESPPYFPRANGLAERAVRTVKTALSSWRESVCHCDFNAFLQKVLFHHRISACSRGKSPAEIVYGRQLRVPVVSRFEQGEDVIYKPSEKMCPRSVTYLMTKGHNTSWVLDGKELRLVSNNQVSASGSSEDSEALSKKATLSDNSSTLSPFRAQVSSLDPLLGQGGEASEPRCSQGEGNEPSALSSCATQAPSQGPLIGQGGEASGLRNNQEWNEPRRSSRSHRAPDRWGYGRDFAPVDSSAKEPSLT